MECRSFLKFCFFSVISFLLWFYYFTSYNVTFLSSESRDPLKPTTKCIHWRRSSDVCLVYRLYSCLFVHELKNCVCRRFLSLLWPFVSSKPSSVPSFFIYIYTLSPNKVIMCILIWLRLNVWVEMVIWNCKICVIIGSFHLVFFVRLFVLIFFDRFRCGFDAMQWPVRSFSAFIHTIRWVFSLNIPLGNIFPLSLLFFLSKPSLD